MRTGFQCLAAILCLTDIAIFHAAAAEPTAPFRIERLSILESPPDYYYMQSRSALVPGAHPRVIVTTQEIERKGSHGYRDLYQIETSDGGKTWSKPERIESLRRVRKPEGYDFVIGDLCPQWHAATKVVLGTGKTFGFREGVREDRSLERVSYTVFSPATSKWNGLHLLELPEKDHEGKPILEPNSGCHQRVDLPNGDILLPIRYRKEEKNRFYTTIVALCSFDGATLKYKRHGTELTLAKGRGLYEPSITAFQGRYFLTMRADDSAYVARSVDGINYEPKDEWKFDDGQILGSYNTQQHWVAHSDALYLVYTRKGANNDHIFRHRAPLFIARVDPERLRVIRATEQVLIPDNHADIGNFGVTDVNPNETWIVTSEGLPQGKRAAENNNILVAKVIWSKPNKLITP
jgi:hypothetical protein